MYADSEDDCFLRHDISGILAASSKVGKALTWCKRFPEKFNGVPIATKYVLIDTKRSATNYKNVIRDRSAEFCLDYKTNEMNDILLSQVQATAQDKIPIRLAEYLSQGSTTILDCGDHHVVGLCGHRVQLRRLKHQNSLPTGKHFKHASEALAEKFLLQTFATDQFVVLYEPFTINFSDEAAIVGGVSVHCYNVDFCVRKKGSSRTVGIEVKKDILSWKWKEKEALFKIQKYEKILGAPCLVLVVQPFPEFHRVTKEGLERFASLQAVIDHVY